MPNAFNKTVDIAFEDILQGMEDGLVVSKLAGKYITEGTDMQRSGDVVWRPMPYVMQSFTGLDQTSNFKDVTQLSVPASLNQNPSVPWLLDAKELRDQLNEGRLAKGARQKIASVLNTAVHNVLANQGSIVVKRTVSATGYDDIGLCRTAMREIGVTEGDFKIALTARDYSLMAGDLAKRATINNKGDKPSIAYESAYIGDVAGFATFDTDTSPRLTAAAGVTVTISAANQFYTPKATVSTTDLTNVDNRFQTISIAVVSGTVKVGDAFTVAGVNSVHHITKVDTGQLKTFRINRIVTGAGGTGTVEITPPFISAGGGTDAEKQYQNITATPANGAAVTFLNTASTGVNCFWSKDAIEILPGRLAVDAPAGALVRRGTLSNGVEVIMTEQFDINTMKTKFRLDTFFGVVLTNTEMAGIMLFNQ